jgi:hypothetical protein
MPFSQQEGPFSGPNVEPASLSTLANATSKITPNMSDKAKNSLTAIPEEILARILRYARPSDLPSILLLCKKMFRLGREEWDNRRPFPISLSGTGLGGADVARGAGYKRRIRTLAVTVVPELDMWANIPSVMNLATKELTNVADLRFLMEQCNPAFILGFAINVANHPSRPPKFSLESIGYDALGLIAYSQSQYPFTSVKVTRETTGGALCFHYFMTKIPEGIERFKALEEVALYNYKIKSRNFTNIESGETISGEKIIQKMIKEIARHITAPSFERLTILSPPDLMSESESLVTELKEIFKGRRNAVEVTVAGMKEAPAGLER